jgi:hypothetical protein
MGVQVLATDQPPEDADEVWVATGQHAASLENVYLPELVGRTDFDAHVRFKPVDMRDLRLPWPEKFDFIWSSCALEHLGSLEAGWQFVLQAMEVVKPGGIAVHTTEFNVASNDETIEEGTNVIYRRRDIEELDRRLRTISCGLSKCDFFAGDDPHDINFDHFPFYENDKPHVKLLIEGHIATSFLLIIRKGAERVDIPAPYASTRGDSDADVSRDELAALREQIGDLQLQLSQMRNSTSWRVTAPLRGVKSLMRGRFVNARDRGTLPNQTD